MNAVVDTNILIDYLNGSTKARTELDKFETVFISLISWMEILIGTDEGDEESEVRAFLRRFQIYPLDEGVAERAVEIRRREKIRLPDAVIWAIAQAARPPAGDSEFTRLSEPGSGNSHSVQTLARFHDLDRALNRVPFLVVRGKAVKLFAVEIHRHRERESVVREIRHEMNVRRDLE